MFNFFKKKKEEPVAAQSPVCNCGSWPDPTWTTEDFLKKQEMVKLCPVHKGLQMVMIATPRPEEPSEPVMGTFGEEIRSARIHLINCQHIPPCTKEMYQRIDGMVADIENIIQEQKR